MVPYMVEGKVKMYVVNLLHYEQGLVLTYAELDLKNTKTVGVDVVFWEIISNSGTFCSK